jgi:hypothetical protein
MRTGWRAAGRLHADVATAIRSGLAALILLTGLPSEAEAQVGGLRTDVSLETRVFAEAPLFPEQPSAPLSPSIVVRPQWSLERGARGWRISAEGFLRVDAHDDRRTHVDVRELGIGWGGARGTLFVGVGRVFWGVAEARHLVDIVNQTDGVEDLDEEDKLGQPMVRGALQGAWGQLEAILLPWFRERTFPAADARLRGPLPVTTDADYDARRGRWHPDVALRWYRPAGAFELGVSAFRGTAREPHLVPDVAGTELRPRYAVIDQQGVDLQWTGDATLLKLEAMTRGGHGPRFWAATVGVEHTLYGVLGSPGDLGLLVEVMADRRTYAAPPTIFDRDVFAGARWSLNDVAATSVLGGVAVDWRSGETFALVEADHRLGAWWGAALEVRGFVRTEPGGPAHGLRRDGFLNLRLTRYF